MYAQNGIPLTDIDPDLTCPRPSKTVFKVAIEHLKSLIYSDGFSSTVAANIAMNDNRTFITIEVIDAKIISYFS